MADFSTLIASIEATIKQNGVQAITGQVLQDELLLMVSAINQLKQDTLEGYAFYGEALPNGATRVVTQNTFFLAGAGSYTINGNAVTITDSGISVIVYDCVNDEITTYQLFAYDANPTSGSANAVTSGGVKSALDTKADKNGASPNLFAGFAGNLVDTRSNGTPQSFIFRQSGGDGRKLLNILELVVDSQSGRKDVVIDNKTVTECLQESVAIYDKDGEMHYDIISAFIKSVRGSDPNAALYYLARMLDGGEDPLFIARRLCLSASEDVGLANPNALLLANATFQVVNQIGMPEARIPLAECTVYLASSPKSNASYMALEEALQVAHEDQTRAVPLHLRNAPTKLMSDLGYSDGYKYAHDFPGHFVDQEFMPEGLEGRVFYKPAQNRHEDVLKAYLEACWPKYYSKEK